MAVHAGRGPLLPGAPVNAAIPLTSTYRAEGDLSYGREGNASWSALEEAIGALEGGQAVAFASGMAAVASVLETLPVGAVVVVGTDAYNGTRAFLDDVAGRGRLEARQVDPTDVEATLAACRGASLLWLESPSNPLLAISDLARLSEGAKALGLTVVADNTFATPLLQRPLDLGVDLVVHSVTKFLAGHSDVLMGAVVSRRLELVEAVTRRRTVHGAVPGPLEAYLALRGVRTLAVRMERAQANAGELAQRLSRHPGVSLVRYPGLDGHPGQALGRRQMRGPGAMLSFEVVGGAGVADAVCRLVRLATPATSLGGVETLIERRQRWPGEEGTPPGLLRLSVGIEDVEDLWRDLDQALAKAAQGVGAAAAQI